MYYKFSKEKYPVIGERIKLELEQQYKNMMAPILKRQEELEILRKQLENQLFVLDTEIYAIRCYFGETIKFTRLREGCHSIETDPIIAYQKVRYLDEEMAKFLAIYDFDAADINYFEEALVARDDLVDVFAPGSKSINLVQISRDGLQYGMSDKCANMLRKYEVFHGTQVGILIRDGDNLWMGWCDSNRIRLQDGNMFYEPKTKRIEIEDDLYQRTSSKEEVASRYFLFYLVQGALDRNDMFKLPEKINILQPSPYLVFSLADGWIEDNRFGEFGDIIKKTNSQKLNVGDLVLTVMKITRDDLYERNNNGQSKVYQSWNNDRGRGEKNRTYDAVLSNRTIYPINHIDRVDIYTVHCKKYKLSVRQVEAESEEDSYQLVHFEKIRTKKYVGDTQHRIFVKNNVIEDFQKNVKGMSPEEILDAAIAIRYIWFDDMIDHLNPENSYYEVPQSIEHTETKYKYYISAVKQESRRWGNTESPATANLEVFPDEYLNLTYLNSVWIRYAITNKKTGGFNIGNQSVNYTTAVPYLQKALQYLDEREREEAELLEKFMVLYPDWQIDLSEWKMANQFHRLTERRAKRYAKEKSLAVE